MSSALPSLTDLEAIASHFSGLLRLLTHDGDMDRSPEICDMLIDRVRDALDRRLSTFSSESPQFIAGSFALEQIFPSPGRTEIRKLRHRDLGTLHALKTVAARHADDAIARNLLLREARIGMTLRHPHVVETQMVLRLPDGRPAIVMEWAGEPVSQRIASGPLSADEIAELMIGLLAGLEAIHDAGYVHCDIAPANLLLQDHNLQCLKIADCGVALELGARHRDFEIRLAGTPPFTAPERQADEAAADVRSDLYSAGIVLNLLLERTNETGSGIERLNTLAQHLTQPDPGDRPASAIATLEYLNTAIHRPSAPFTE